MGRWCAIGAGAPCCTPLAPPAARHTTAGRGSAPGRWRVGIGAASGGWRGTHSASRPGVAHAGR
eukprot:408247-Prymnesium_polylepis.1